MFKTFVLLFCLSVTLGVGYSAINGTAIATPTASNTSTTAKPATPTKLTTPSNKSTTASTNSTTKPTAITNSTSKPSTSTNSTSKPSTSTTSTSKPTASTNSTSKPSASTTSTSKPTASTNSTSKPSTSTNSTSKPTASTNSTSKPSTSTNSTSKTTASTNSTTTAKPTTLPPSGTFSLKEKNTKEYCLLAKFEVTFTINYLANVSNVNGSNIMEKNGTIYLGRSNNKDVTIDGDCGSNITDAKLVLTWPKNTSLYNLTMVFSEVAKGLEAKSNSNKWRVKMITLNVTLEDNPDFKHATVKSFTSTFNGSATTYDVGGYYSCNSKDDSRTFKTTIMNYTVHPVFEDVKLEPFVSKNTSDAFGKDKFPCYQDAPTKPSVPPTTASSGNNDIVPIAVGCALAGLVLIVLIAYIIGRRKSHRGYEKV